MCDGIDRSAGRMSVFDARIPGVNLPADTPYLRRRREDPRVCEIATSTTPR
jgi:hypothetical protein